LNPYRSDFPILKTAVNGKDLVYFDNAATTQKPVSVMEAVKKYYEEQNANFYRCWKFQRNNIHKECNGITESYSKYLW